MTKRKHAPRRQPVFTNGSETTTDQATVLEYKKEGGNMHSALRVVHQEHCPKFGTNIALISIIKCECDAVRLFVDSEGGTSEWLGGKQ